MARDSVDTFGRARFLYAGPYTTRTRAEKSLSDSFADGDVSLGDRPRIVCQSGKWWVEVNG